MQPGAHIGKGRVIAKIVKLVTVLLKVKQHRAIAFRQDIFETPVIDHPQPRLARRRVEGAPCVLKGIVIFTYGIGPVRPVCLAKQDRAQ